MKCECGLPAVVTIKNKHFCKECDREQNAPVMRMSIREPKEKRVKKFKLQNSR